MKLLLLSVLIFSSPVISEVNNQTNIFFDITMRCKTYRILISQDKSQEIESNCIKSKLEENNLSKTKYNKWNKEYYKTQKEAWNKFFKNLEKNG